MEYAESLIMLSSLFLFKFLFRVKVQRHLLLHKSFCFSPILLCVSRNPQVMTGSRRARTLSDNTCTLDVYRELLKKKSLRKRKLLRRLSLFQMLFQTNFIEPQKIRKFC